MRGIAGPVVMLNLLRFRAIADYSASPELAPSLPISGAAAFDRYVMHTLPLLRASGGDVILLGSGDRFRIGPPEERWDLAMLVRQHGKARAITSQEKTSVVGSARVSSVSLARRNGTHAIGHRPSASSRTLNLYRQPSISPTPSKANACRRKTASPWRSAKALV
jgi:hypothetical protein